MSKKLMLENHPSNLIVEASETREFLCNVYDSTFPITIFRNRINFIGGGREKDDYSPEHLMRREISEEISLEENIELDRGLRKVAGGSYVLPRVGEMASPQDIEKLRETLLKSMRDYQDFLIEFHFTTEKPKLNYPHMIFSVFYSQIPQEVFEMVRRSLASKKSLVNDSFLKIVSIDDLVKGDPLTAWACGRIFSHYLGKEIPNSDGTKAEPIGLPRKSFQDYLKEFEYLKF